MLDVIVPFDAEDDDWNIVVIETGSLSSRWEKLVVRLGLTSDLIDSTIRPASAPWDEALKQWINQNYNTTRFGLPSWRTLLKAVAQVNKRQAQRYVAISYVVIWCK